MCTGTSVYVSLKQCVYVINWIAHISSTDNTQCEYLVSIPKPVIYIYTDFPLIRGVKVLHIIMRIQQVYTIYLYVLKLCYSQGNVKFYYVAIVYASKINTYQ